MNVRISVCAWRVLLFMATVSSTYGHAAWGLVLGDLVDSSLAHVQRQLDVFYNDGPRIPQAYANLPGLQYDGFSYDSGCLAVLAANQHRLDLAQPVADAFLVLQESDRIPDGRLHEAYWPNDLLDPSGQYASVKGPDISPGPMAWPINGLLEAYEVTGRQAYLDGAIRSAEFIRDSFWAEDGPGGFTAGLIGWNAEPAVYRITEGNIATFVIGRKLHQLTGDAKWASMAQHAQQFVQAMWDKDRHVYLSGTRGVAGTQLNPSPVPADVQALAVLAGIDDPARTEQSLDWVMNELLVSDEVAGQTFWGIRFSDAGTHINAEITAEVAMALIVSGRKEDGEWLLGELDKTRLQAPNHDPDGIGIVATPSPDCATTGFGSIAYPNALHVASTAWLGLAARVAEGDLSANPFFVVPEPSSAVLLILLLTTLGATRLGKRYGR